MNRAPAWLALLAIGALVAPVAAEPCARATLSGSPAAVAAVATELHRLGVTTAAARAADRCRSIAATIEPDGEGLAIAIGAPGRSEGRVVGDARVAAAWIDSWLHDDGALDEPAPEPVLAPPAPPLAPPGAAVDRVAAPRAPATSGALLDRVAIAALYERGYTSDGGTSDGASASACVRVGFACLGARARGAFEAQRGYGDRGVQASRSDLSLLATASAPFAIGRMVIEPELGVGVGRFATDRAPTCHAQVPVCNPADPTCASNPPPPCPSDASGAAVHVPGETRASYGPRAAAALRLAVPLFDRVWLDGLAAVTVSPLHATAQTVGPVDASTGMPLPPLPAEPVAAFQLGVGLRIGAP